VTDVGIVGAGAGAAAAAFVIDRTVPDADVTVVEKSGGLCGRAATRRHEDLTYDYGANYLKSDDDRVVELITETLDDEGLVDVTDPVYTFDADGEVSPGRDADEHKWSYRRGLTQIARRLFGRTDATVHRRTRVETVRRVDGTGAADGDGAADDRSPSAAAADELARATASLALALLDDGVPVEVELPAGRVSASPGGRGRGEVLELAARTGPGSVPESDADVTVVADASGVRFRTGDRSVSFADLRREADAERAATDDSGRGAAGAAAGNREVTSP